jgi:hypothetical protein
LVPQRFTEAAGSDALENIHRTPPAIFERFLVLTGGNDSTRDQIAKHIGAGPDMTDTLLAGLGELVARPRIAIATPLSPKKPAKWRLTNAGKSYLARFGLIQ